MSSRENSQSPRRRTNPLLPEPFDELLIARQPFWRFLPLFAPSFCKFCPDLDVPHYRNQLSEEKKTELDRRANRLVKRACTNQLLKASEFNWEADAWHDVFGLIRDDDTFRIDKRPYEFIERDIDNNISVKKRIPDATIGLRSYDAIDLARGYRCTMSDCKVNHDSMQPHESLSDDRIRSQMYKRECGLIVDGIWGETNLMFPFAVYEAKKSAESWENAENQVYHACSTYLAMLDALARNPTDVTRYQSKESERVQLFGFTSCGPLWRVYIAWNLEASCHVETIWQGDVKDFSRAYELHCIVDQIHVYAASQHRAFVIKHLEPWLKYAEKRERARFKKILRLHPGEILADPPRPEWYIIKEASKEAANAKAANTRKLKRTVISEDPCSGKTSYPPQTLQRKAKSTRLDVAQLPAKRGRGRPRKQETEKSKELGLVNFQAKRPRGRPRKVVAKCQPKQRSGRPKKGEN